MLHGGLDRRLYGPRRRPLFAFQAIQTLRYEVLHRAGLLVHPDGRPTLEVGTSTTVQCRFEDIAERLARAA